MPRYLSMIRIDESTVTAGPSPALLERMGRLIDAMNKAGFCLKPPG